MKRVKKVLLCLSSMPVLLYGMCVYASDGETEYNDTGIYTVADARNTFTEGYEKSIKESIGEPTPTYDIYEIKSQEVLDKQEKLSSIEDNEEWFIDYKDLIEEYSEWVDPPETIYDYYTEDEIYLMQRCIETETFEADFDSKVNVASVILNRIESDEFANEVSEIIVKGQFAFGRENISEDTVLALEYAFMIGDTTNGALYFHSNPKTETFNGAEFIFTDTAGHHFYK